MSIPVPSIPDQDVEDFIEQALEEIGKACTPEWIEVCTILAELHEIYCKRIEEVNVAEYYKTVDRLMQAYNKWIG